MTGRARPVGEVDVLELDPAALPVAARAAPSAGPAASSSASSRSNTRSALAIPDCSVLYMPATWVSGWLNCRTYWMNAWMLPSVIWPGRHLDAADHRHRDIAEVADERGGGPDQPGEELCAEAGVVDVGVAFAELLLGSAR